MSSSKYRRAFEQRACHRPAEPTSESGRSLTSHAGLRLTQASPDVLCFTVISAWGPLHRAVWLKPTTGRLKGRNSQRGGAPSRLRSPVPRPARRAQAVIASSSRDDPAPMGDRLSRRCVSVWLVGDFSREAAGVGGRRGVHPNAQFSRTTRPTPRSQPQLHRPFGAHPAAC